MSQVPQDIQYIFPCTLLENKPLVSNNEPIVGVIEQYLLINT